jgi:hypothetical protein
VHEQAKSTQVDGAAVFSSSGAPAEQTSAFDWPLSNDDRRNLKRVVVADARLFRKKAQEREDRLSQYIDRVSGEVSDRAARRQGNRPSGEE